MHVAATLTPALLIRWLTHITQSEAGQCHVSLSAHFKSNSYVKLCTANLDLCLGKKLVCLFSVHLPSCHCVSSVWPDWGWWCQCPGVLWCLQMSLVWLWGHFTASQPPPLTLVTANGWYFGWTLWDKNKYLNKWINSRYLELCLSGSWGVTEYHYQLQRDQIVPTKWQYKLHQPMIFY